MRPALFSTLTREQALAAFGADRRAQTFCGGDLVKTEAAVLVFATVGGPTGARLDYADQIVWSPSPDASSTPLARHSFWPSSMPDVLRGTLTASHKAMSTFLPEEARDCWDESREHRLFDHVLLLRHLRDGDGWLYCGRVHLGSYGETTADFTLEEGRLSAGHWQAFDGWTGWRVMICGDWQDMQRDEVRGFADRLDARSNDEKLDIFLNAWTGETFAFYFNAHRAAVFHAAAMGEPWTLRVRDPREDMRGTEPEPFFDSLGPCETTIERFRTIPRGVAPKLAASVFVHGESPKSGDLVRVDTFCGDWTDW